MTAPLGLDPAPPSPWAVPVETLHGAVLEALSDLGEGLLVVEAGKVLYANDAYCRLTGYSPSELMALPSILDLCPEDVQAQVADRARRRLAGEPVEDKFESAMLTKDGRRVEVEVAVRAIGPSRNLVLARDLTERRRAEAERRAHHERKRELDRLHEMDRFKTQVVNAAAHELATPLTPIKIQIHALKTREAERLTPSQRRAVEILDRNVDRLAALVQDVLDVARLQGGRLAVERRATALDVVVAEAVDSFHEPARRAGLALDAEVEPDLVVEGDAKRLLQVLYNLLTNAVKFTPAGGRVGVRARRAGDRARVEVRDTGAGVRPEDVPRLFRPFTQLHDTTRSAHGGSGLGLFICRGIVDEHGGRIWCESDGAGKGSTFVFEVPLHVTVGRST